MVSALYILVAALAAAFLLGLLKERSKGTAFYLTLATLTFMTWVSGSWVWVFLTSDTPTAEIWTAGTLPPFAINLRMGLPEAVLTLLVNSTGLLSALYLKDALYRLGRRGMAVLIIAIMALCGVILTRDIFNLFVFFELIVISTAGLVLLSDDERALGAGYKYMIVSQVISIFLLIGIIFAYHATGTLNIDGMAGASINVLGGGTIAFFFMFIAIVAELKPFPANGWALDIYESAHPSFSAIFSAASGTAALFAVDKLLLIGGPQWLALASGIGAVTFVLGNLLALPQTSDRRLLGYSSIAQTGLVMTVLGQRDILGDATPFVALGLLLSHAVAKAGLYWMSGLIQGRTLTDWTSLRGRPVLIFAFVTFICMLSGLPPFPGFYAKWELIRVLAGEGRLFLLAFILLGALMEAGYLFRWFGYIIKREQTAAPVACAMHQRLPILIALVGAWVLGYVWGSLSGRSNLMTMIPLLFALSFLLLDWLPAWVKNTLAILGMLFYFYSTWQEYDPLRLIFSVIFLLGGVITLLASYESHGRRIGFFPAVTLMFAGLIMLIRATDSFDFFAAWELLTVGSYFLILRGKQSEPHALSYILFSLGGAFLILTGFAVAAQGANTFAIAALGQLGAPLAPWVFVLLAIGFMTKTAAIGLHVWLPGAHAEAETDVSPMVSGILLKAGLYGLIVLLMTMGKQQLYGVELTHAMLWIAALTALLGNLMAIFQEDAKRLLAYSSIGQMGYAMFGLALMNHLGWLMALMFVINHYIYKAMLFLAVGGVAKRTGTKDMYCMGGLITLMPLSFIAVLVGIIAVSGLPPLSGFGGRWIFYNAIISAEYRLPMILIFLAGPIAFLYLFRLIYAIFLGQLKDEFRRVKEAPFWIILPQMIYVVLLLVFAVFPGIALRRVDAYLSQFFPDGALGWAGNEITSTYGYWNPIAIMISVMVIFGTLFAWLLIVDRKAQRVKQFNIVFSAERPFRPETTHFAWNFFAPYRKALGFLVTSLATIFWNGFAELLHAVADFVRRLYNGNGQSYAFHFLAFVLIAFLFRMGA